MEPRDPNEPLPTTPVAPEPARPAAPPPAGGWGPPPTWAAPPATLPAPAPPRRDRLALAIVAFIFGGLFLVFFGFLVLAYGAVRGETPTLSGGPKIGVIEVKGPIGMDGGVDAERVMKHVRKFADDSGIKGVLVRIDSPGGAVGPTQEIFAELRRLAEKKPVVCSLGSLAASGGFYVAMACPKVIASASTLTGSIGVISQFPNVRRLADKLGVDVETVKSGRLKDVGNPFRDMGPEERAYWQAVSDRIHAQFIAAVVGARGKSEVEVRKVADGRVITGDQALEAGLVDGLGNFYDALDLVKSEAKITGEPTLVYPADERSRFLEQLMGGAAHALAGAVREGLAAEAVEARSPGVYFLAR